MDASNSVSKKTVIQKSSFFREKITVKNMWSMQPNALLQKQFKAPCKKLSWTLQAERKERNEEKRLHIEIMCYGE